MQSYQYNLVSNKEISSFINEVAIDKKITDFYSLSEDYQDKFTALCIRAFGCDVDIVIGSDANNHLVKYLFTADKDEAFELLEKVKESARDHVSHYFDTLLLLS